ncbi:MAG TPA: glycoside hydrolase family 20 zincin-like fold domain-containing protein, partial [Acidimicrobiales bacterium]|nr:glycoside hydrolase family 20 zincin-like fold domain-containing protein [Acidimicrobiales bacterium]
MNRLLPRPASFAPGEGTVTWTSPLHIATDTAFEGVARRFGADLADALGWDVAVAESGPIVLREVEGFGDEGYRLSVDTVTVIEATAPAGASYALTALRQIGPAAMWSRTHARTDAIEIPRVRCEDAPRFAWRGAHLDVARHFFD